MGNNEYNKNVFFKIEKSMKKLMIVLAMAGLSTGAFAQQTNEVVNVPTEKYSVSTNSFWSNWFLQVGADYSAFYSNQEQGVSKSPLKTLRRDYGFDVAIGKWFTPGLGLRTKFNGIWGKQVNTPSTSGKFDYYNLHEDVLFNLSNMLCGYSDTRVWNFIPYVGAGFARNCSADIYAMTYNAGLLNTWRLCDRVNLNLDLGLMAAEKDFDGNANAVTSKSIAKRGWRAFDKAFTASIGFTVNLGKNRFNKTPDVDAIMALNAAQVDALNSALAAQQAENANLKSELAKKPKEVVKTETVDKVLAADQSVFFNLGSSKIASKKDLVNLESLANMAKETGAKLKVTGYADSATGSASLNQKLSEARANKVADELVKLGVSRDNLIVEGLGGVSTLKPNSYNRRVIISAAE